MSIYCKTNLEGNSMTSKFDAVATRASIHEADKKNKKRPARDEFKPLFPADHEPSAKHPRPRKYKTRDDLLPPSQRRRAENVLRNKNLTK